MKKRQILVLCCALLLFPTTGFAVQEVVAVDGDSLTIGERRIRLDGIDAPEFEQQCENAQGQKYACGHEALAYLQQLLAQQKPDCRCLSHKDRYQREICECFSGKISLNRAMVQAGWATAYRDERYLTDEKTARRLQQGIWQGKNMRPAIYRALSKYKQRKTMQPAEHRNF